MQEKIYTKRLRKVLCKDSKYKYSSFFITSRGHSKAMDIDVLSEKSDFIQRCYDSVFICSSKTHPFHNFLSIYTTKNTMISVRNK